MKKLRFILTAVLVTLTSVFTIMYTSCRPDACSGVACSNGGTCSGGTCSCPSNYTGSRCQTYLDPCSSVTCYNGGTCAGGYCTCPTGYTGPNCEYAVNTTLTYRNNSYTTLHLTINGASYTIPALTASSFTGTAGSSITVSDIYTYGSFGETITWSTFGDNFPSTGEIVEQFNVSAEYFFLQMRNISSYSLNSLYVNYNSSAETHEFPYIPNDGVTYGVGYYLAYSNTEVYAESGGFYWDWFPTIPYTQNAFVTVTATD